MWERNLELQEERDDKFLCKNKTVMECTFDYVRERGVDIKLIKQLNYVRLKKQVLLLCKLVRLDGRKHTLHYQNLEELSPID